MYPVGTIISDAQYQNLPTVEQSAYLICNGGTYDPMVYPEGHVTLYDEFHGRLPNMLSSASIYWIKMRTAPALKRYLRPYIAGPITGFPDGNKAAFYRTEARLTAAGLWPINPRANGSEGEMTWLDYMRISLRQIAESGGVCYLEEWEVSKGASIEVRLARDLGLPTGDEDWWVVHGEQLSR